MFYGLVIAIHIFSCLFLIAVILLQAGRGGGLSDAFGGTSTQTIFGQKANVFLTRATTACAIIYIFTCLLLGVLTSRRGRSLLETGRYMPQTAPLPPLTQPIEEKREEQVAPKVPQEESKEEDVVKETEQNLPEAKPGEPQTQ